MEGQFLAFLEQCRSEIALAKSSKEVDLVKLRFLGKSGILHSLMGTLRTVSPEKKASFGKQINDLKIGCAAICEEALTFFLQREESHRIEQELLDVTLPGRRVRRGKKHPLSLLLDDILLVFTSMGFSVQCGPDVDSDWYNYEGLNFPKDHPARDMQDTFYIDSERLLRSHTSNTQLRLMQQHAPPIRVVVPGTVFRNENISARSHVCFHQIEGVYIDENVSFADLFTTLEEFWNKLLRVRVDIRFRPSYFPFVAPGLEVDIRCTQCGGSGCRLCKHSGWLEVAGAGMIHPKVLANGGVDPERYRGYAWGMGLERLAMLQYGVPDIRLFMENDFRFLSQF